jgi:hypothetical protein
VAKPEIQISAPTTLVVGERCVIEFDVTVEKETKLEFLEARIEGQQGWAVGSGKSRVTHRVKYPQLVSRLMGEGVLPAATTTRFSTSFVLPLGTPPSHEISPASARLLLRIHASIPWWFDGRYHYVFQVRLPPPPVVQRTPFAIRSTPLSVAADKPRIEVALASTRLIVGETLVGSVAVFHMDDRKPREVDLTLVPMLVLHGRGRARERRGEAVGVTITLPAGSAGTSVPFRLQIPSTIPPSFETVTHKLSWWLVAMSGSFFGGKVDVSVPLEIVDASAAATTAKLTAAPRLGDERIATLFAQFAARVGWRGATIDDDEDERFGGQFAIEGEVEGCRVRLAYAYRGEEGTFLVASIVHPSLGLDLTVVPSSSLRHVFFQDIEVDIGAWDRAHHVTARSPAQTIPPLQAIVPALMRSGRLGSLVRWDDEAIMFERPMSAVLEPELAVMRGELEQLATAIAAARPTIAPPPGLTVELDAWHALAMGLDAKLSVGDLSIAGKADGVPVELGLEWNDDKQPTSLRVAVGDPEAASAELRQIVLSLRDPAADVLGDPAAERLVDPVTRWPADFIDLRVTDGVASASYVVVGAALDAKRARELVLALRAVLAALDPGTGPYR